jgi:toxin ParE1/3/4
MLKVEWTDQALEKMEEIADYISADSPKAATKWISSVFGKEIMIQSNPNIGREVPEYKNSLVREVFEGRYRIIYRIEKKKISVITVKNFKEQMKSTIA